MSKKTPLLYLLLMACSLMLLLPFAYLICAAIKPNADFFTSLFLPTGDGAFGIAWGRLTLSHFDRLFRSLDFGNYVLNSFFLASVTSVLATLFCAMGGYALAKFQFRGRAAMTAAVLSATIVPAALLLAPTYQLLYWFGLLDTFAGVILPTVVPAFGVYLFRQAIISSLPDEVLEAARIDGCGEVRIFFTMALPLVRPMIGAFLLVTYLGTWNNFIWPQVVLQSADKLPLSVAIAQLKSVYSQDYGLLMAGTLVSRRPRSDPLHHAPTRVHRWADQRGSQRLKQSTFVATPPVGVGSAIEMNAASCAAQGRTRVRSRQATG